MSWVEGQFTVEALECRVLLIDGDLLVTDSANDRVMRYDGETGAFIGVFASGGGLDEPTGLTFGPDRNLYVSGFESDNVVRYSGTTGTLIDNFVPPGFGGIDHAHGITFGPDGNLYLSDHFHDRVLRYDGTTGAFMGPFTPVQPDIDLAAGLVFGPDGNLYVCSAAGGGVRRHDGQTGAFIDIFVAGGSGGLSVPQGLTFGPDGNLYVASSGSHSVLKYNGTTGAFINNFATGNGLQTAYGLTFGPDGNLYVTSFQNDSVLKFDGQSGTFISTFVTPGSGGLNAPKFLTFVPDMTPPIVTSASFQITVAPHAVEISFSEDVSSSLSAADVELVNLTTGFGVPAAAMNLAYDHPTNTATLTFPGIPNGLLADGDYQLTLLAAGITDPSGNPLDGDGNGTPGGDFLFDFFFLAGDANHDGRVNLDDFNILAANFGQSPRDFTQGDFNYDSVVNLADFDLLAARFGTVLETFDVERADSRIMDFLSI